MKGKRGLARLAWAFLLAMLLSAGLVACNQSQQGESSSEGQEPDASASAVSVDSSGSGDLGDVEKSQTELYGHPWVTSIFVGNQPDEAPDAADDLYLHYGYDFMTAESFGFDATSVIYETSGEVQDAVTATIKDGSVTNPELEQLRIFYSQAADLDALGEAGIDELRPYLDAIMATESLDELNQVLASDDFPFTPWIKGTVGAADMRSKMGVFVLPNLLFTDELTGGDVYKDSDDKWEETARELLKATWAYDVTNDLILLGFGDEDESYEEAMKYFELEKTYGTYTDMSKENLRAEYGAEAKSLKTYTMDELQAACPNFPIKETYAKLGKDKADEYIVYYPEWVAAFNEVWTEENFETLRAMTAVKVLRECSPYIDPSLYDGLTRYSVSIPVSADEFAYAACDKPTTFGQVVAKTYVEQYLGEEAWQDLTDLSNDLIDSYIVLVNNTPWLDSQSKAAIIEKIDNMQLNVLYPDGGYFDYSGLNLVPSDQGGTLIGNYLRVKEYNNQCEAALIGTDALANSAWLIFTPTELNCFYDCTSNSINIFPGFVTSSMYTTDMSDEEMLAGIGFVMGHEISHAFDFTGSQFNAYGEGVSVYSDGDVQEFVDRRQRLADYFSTIEVEPGVFVNGVEKSTEAAADLCGLQVLLEHAKTLDSFDYEKFFGRFAYNWASSYPPIYKSLLYVDVHPLDNLRVNVSAQMFDEFYSTFGVVEGDGMYLAPEDRIIMWGPNA